MTSSTRVPRTEIDLGYFTAHNKGLDEARAREVPRWRESDVFTPLERRFMEYAEVCGLQPLVTRTNPVGPTR